VNGTATRPRLSAHVSAFHSRLSPSKCHFSVGPSLLKLQRHVATMDSYLAPRYSAESGVPDKAGKLAGLDGAVTITPCPEHMLQNQPQTRSSRGDIFRALAYAAALAVATIEYSGKAKADCPLGDVVPNALPASVNWVNGFPKPVGMGDFTGADASIDSPYVWIATNAGFLHKYDFTDKMNPILMQSVNTGIAGLSGVTLTPNGLTLSAGTSLYEGTVSGGTWNTANIRNPTGITSNITDVHYARVLGLYFIGTTNDGVRRVNADNTTTETVFPRQNNAMALKQQEYIDGFCNPTVQVAGSNTTFRACYELFPINLASMRQAKATK